MSFSVRSNADAYTSCSLPGLTNRLVVEVLAANPRTIVVNQSGTPVEVPWINDAHTLLQVSMKYRLRFLILTQG